MIPSTGDFSGACIKDIQNLSQASEVYFNQDIMLDWTTAKNLGKCLYSGYL